MKRILLFSLFIVSFFSYAQELTMQNGSWTECNFLLTDSGGSNANYSNNEDLTLTLCPQATDGYVILSFFEFSTQSASDVLTIYNGDSIDSPIIGEYSGTNSPNTIQADNASGCLTLHFVSDNSGTATGWFAEVLCVSTFSIVQPSDFTICNDGNDGFGVFDLSSKDQEILGGLPSQDYSVSYYNTLIDASNNTNPLPSPYTNTSNPQTIYVSVVQNSTGLQELTQFDLWVNQVPTINLSDVYELCDGTSLIVDSGLTASEYNFEWYLDGIVLNGETNPSLTVIQAGSYTLLVNSLNGCFSYTNFEVILFQINTVVALEPYSICDDNDDGFAEFDLSTITPEVSGGNPNPTFLISYHETLVDAETGMNALNLMYTNSNANFQTIYVRVGTTFGDCYQILTLDLLVEVNCISVFPAVIETCTSNPNGLAEFDLTSSNSDIIGGQNESDFTFSYFISESNAIAEVNPITSPSNFFNTGNSQTIYVRVVEIATSDFAIAELTLVSNLVPQIQFEGPYTICSDTEVVITPILDGFGNNQYSYLWNTGAVDPEIVVFTPGTYTVTITNNASGCSATASTTVVQGNSPSLTAIDDIFSCVPNSIFDLTATLTEILNGQDESLFSISFFDNPNSAFSNTNAIFNPTNFIALEATETIFVRVQNNSDACFSIVNFNIITENSCVIPLDCAEGIVNVNFCYESSQVTEYYYQSTDDSMLQVFFNAGQVEVNYDELVVLDSDGVTNLNPTETTYGNNGDLTGLSFTSTGNSIRIAIVADGSISCFNQNYTPIDFDVSCVDPNALPGCNTTLIQPVDGAVEVEEYTDLVWTASSGIVNGYKLSLGLTSGGTEILNNVDVGNVLTYNPGILDYEVTYYVNIIPYNDNGDAENCQEFSFTTRANPNQIVVCQDGAVNTLYCYENNDTSQFGFQSSDGLPLTLYFNSGSTEVNYDEVYILDSDGTVLNPNLPYGNAGDFTGLSYTSSGDTITLVYDTDGSINCTLGNEEPFDFDVYCASSIGIINVNAFVDANVNSTFDSGEFSFSNGYFTYEINNDGTINTVNSSTGHFQILSLNDTDTYDITFNLYEESAGCYDITTAAFTDISVATGNTLTLDFPVVEEQNCEDLAVYLLNYTAPPRPGFTHYNYLVLENLGFSTINSGTVSYTLDSQLVLNNVNTFSPNYIVTTTASGFTIDFVNLEPGDVHYIFISLTCPVSVPLGAIVTNTANYMTNSNDLVAVNNYSTLSEVVVGSYDPNDKMESHGPRIVYNDFVNSDEYLYYTIRFQNLGTAEAITVRIEDALDAQLDETTFQMLRSSHDYVVMRNESDLEWTFDNINLPAEQDDEAGSQGFVYFKIKPKPGYTIGDIIPNTAAIYFDFNAPVITNRFDSEFVEDALSISEFDSMTYEMLPNPAKDIVTIRLNSNTFENGRIQVTDLQGKQILVQNFSEGTSQLLDVSNLQSGIYFVKVTVDHTSIVKKLVKE